MPLSISFIKVKQKTIKFLEENIGENLGDTEFGSEFLDTTTKAQSLKEKNDIRIF